MKSAQAWMVGLIALGGIGALTLPPRIKSMQTELQSRINAKLAEPAFQGVVAVADGQEVSVYLTLDFKGNDGPARLEAAAAALRNIKGLDGLTHQGGWWYGPVTQVKIHDERVSPQALAAEKGVTLFLPASQQGPVSAATASSHSSASSESLTDLVDRCNGGIQVALGGRSLTFASGGSRLTPESEATLDAVAAALRNCPSNVGIDIGGLVQAGESDSNQGPAFRRAQTVADALVLRGYDPYRLNIHVTRNGTPPKDGQGDDRQVALLAVAR